MNERDQKPVASRMFASCIHAGFETGETQVRKVALRLEKKRKFVVVRKQRTRCKHLSNTRLKGEKK